MRIDFGKKPSINQALFLVFRDAFYVLRVASAALFYSLFASLILALSPSIPATLDRAHKMKSLQER
jgi:hypothetical protein